MRKIILAIAGIGMAVLLYSRFKPAAETNVAQKEISAEKVEEKVVTNNNEESSEVALRRQRRAKLDSKTEKTEPVVAKVKAPAKAKKSVDNSLSPEERKAQKLESFAAAAKLEEIAANMDRQMENALMGVMNLDLSEKQRRALEGIRESVSGERYLRDLKSEISKNLTEKDLDDLNTIYNDPIVNDVVNRKFDYQTPEGQKNFAQTFAEFDPESIPKDRREILAEVGNGSMEKEATVEGLGKIFKSSMNLARGEGQSVEMSPEQVKAFTDSISKNIDRANLAMNREIFRNYSNEQIKHVAKLQKSEAFRKQQEVINNMSKKMTNKLVDVMDNAAKG